MGSRQSIIVAAVSSLVLLVSGACAFAAGPADDYAVAAKVEIALMALWPLDARLIKVSSIHGEVNLSGFVDSATSKAEAARVAGMVRGVTAVRDALVIENRAFLLRGF